MRAFLVSIALLAAACTTPEPATPPSNADQATAQDTCGANAFRHLIGTAASAIDRSTLPPRARVIMPGQMVTMDFSAERLNIRVAPDGKVTEVGCF